FDGVGKWTFGDDERLQLAVDVPERLLVEASAHLAGVDQFIALVQAEHQRAEVVALPVREAADDEFLFGGGLDLQPAMAAAAFVPAIAALRQDPFEPVLASGFEHGIAIGEEMVGVADAIGGLENLFQK